MEQEPERELLSDAIKRIGYKVRLAGHFIFIILAFIFIILSIAILALGEGSKGLRL